MSRPLGPTHSRTPKRTAAAIGSAAALVGALLIPAGAASADSDAVTFFGTTDTFGVNGTSDAFMASTTSPTGAWFVQLAGAPTTQGGSASAIARGQDTFESEVADLDVDVDVLHTYTQLWNGVSVQASDDDVTEIAEVDNVVAVYPVMAIDAPESGTPSVPQMLSALSMTGADIAQSELGFTGTGIKVGVIDTGVDYDHPDLGGNGVDDPANFPNDRVVTGYDFVGDSYDADDSGPTYQPIPHPDADPDDCQGHGTHVAGIIGASGDPSLGGIRGVAPDVEIGAYRVFGCNGSTTSDIMLAAMERALADGMDVVNQSIGSAFSSWPQYPTAVGSDNLVDAGVVMVASIGNEGDMGLYASGAPGVGEKVIGVASYDNTMVQSAAVTIDGQMYGYASATGAAPTPTTGSLPLVPVAEIGTPGYLACTAADITNDVTGAAALLSRGTCSFYEKALAAQQGGAAAVVIANNVPGLLNPTVEGAEPITIPVILIGLDEGNQAYADSADGATLMWTDRSIQTPNPTGGLISSFSSYGLAADLSLKPDLGAPGGSIYSTYPLEIGGYATLSGTSMASPHVAGAAALFLQAHPDSTPAQVRDAMLNSADPAPFALAPTAGVLEPVNHQGAGMLDIDDAILATTVVTPSKLSLGESEGGPVTNTLSVTNNGTAPVTYQIAFEDAVSTSQNPADGTAESPVSVDVPGFVLAESTVDAPAEVTVNPGQTATFDVTISPSADYDLVQYGGYIYLLNGDERITVPYAGFAGDYQSLQMLTPGDFGLPALAQLQDCSRLVGVDCTADGSWNLAEAGTVYSMSNGDVPTILLHLNAPAQNLQIDIYKATKNGSRGPAVGGNFNTYLDVDYVGRTGGGPNSFVPYTWDGTRQHKKGTKVVPDGNYILVVTVINALGDPRNPDHVEIYQSPAFTIDRNGDGR